LRIPGRRCATINSSRESIVVSLTFIETGPIIYNIVSQDTYISYIRSLKEVQKKLEKQRLALTRLAAAAWGFSLIRAREVYTKVIRSAIAYGAAAYHKTTEQGGRPRGIARELLTEQTQCLRAVQVHIGQHQ
jgi:hypothetical protein